MAKLPLPFLKVYRDRHRKWRYYVRLAGKKPVRLSGNPLCRDLDKQPAHFMEEYRAAVGAVEATPRGKAMARPGSMSALIAEFRQTPEYRRLKPRSRQEYDRYLDRIAETYGTRAVALLDRAAVERIRDKLLDTPRVANWYVQLFRMLCKLAIGRGYRSDDPTHGVKLAKAERHYEAWSEAAVDAVLRVANDRERLAILLLLHTGQRRGDVAKMLWSHYDGQRISVVQDKTGERLWIPCHGDLKAALDVAMEGRKHASILVSGHGRAFDSSGLGVWLSKLIARAGFKGKLVVHGLRASAAVRLAEAGCSEKEIAAITGHRTLRMVQHYTKDAERGRLALAAMEKVERLDSGRKTQAKTMGQG